MYRTFSLRWFLIVRTRDPFTAWPQIRLSEGFWFCNKQWYTIVRCSNGCIGVSSFGPVWISISTRVSVYYGLWTEDLPWPPLGFPIYVAFHIYVWCLLAGPSFWRKRHLLHASVTFCVVAFVLERDTKATWHTC